ncbi:hypothetical protein Tco_0370490 [Tanacetum coccineum]
MVVNEEWLAGNDEYIERKVLKELKLKRKREEKNHLVDGQEDKGKERVINIEEDAERKRKIKGKGKEEVVNVEEDAKQKRKTKVKGKEKVDDFEKGSEKNESEKKEEQETETSKKDEANNNKEEGMANTKAKNQKIVGEVQKDGRNENQNIAECSEKKDEQETGTSKKDEADNTIRELYEGSTAAQWKTGLLPENDKNHRMQMDNLRSRIAAKILLHEVNIYQKKMSDYAKKMTEAGEGGSNRQ